MAIDKFLGIEAAWLDDDRLGALMEALAKHAAKIWQKVIVRAIAQFSVVLEWLHADTTSVYLKVPTKMSKVSLSMKPYATAFGGRLQQGRQTAKRAVRAEPDSQPARTLAVPSWDGNQSDDGVYLADLNSLRQSGLD